jgi:hypothetical protein
MLPGLDTGVRGRESLQELVKLGLSDLHLYCKVQ